MRSPGCRCCLHAHCLHWLECLREKIRNCCRETITIKTKQYLGEKTPQQNTNHLDVAAEELSPAGARRAGGSGWRWRWRWRCSDRPGAIPLSCTGQPKGQGRSGENESRTQGDPAAPLGNLREKNTAPRSMDGRTGGDKGLPHSPEVMEKESLKLPQAHTFQFQRSGMEMTVIHYQVLKGFLAFWGVRSYVSKRCHCRFCLYMFPTHRKVSIRAI